MHVCVCVCVDLYHLFSFSPLIEQCPSWLTLSTRPQSPFLHRKFKGGSSDQPRGGVSNPPNLTPDILPWYSLPYFANQAPTQDVPLKGEELQVMYLNSTISEVPCYGGWVMTACTWVVIVLACSSGAVTPGCCFTSRAQMWAHLEGCVRQRHKAQRRQFRPPKS